MLILIATEHYQINVYRQVRHSIRDHSKIMYCNTHCRNIPHTPTLCNTCATSRAATFTCYETLKGPALTDVSELCFMPENMRKRLNIPKIYK